MQFHPDEKYRPALFQSVMKLKITLNVFNRDLKFTEIDQFRISPDLFQCGVSCISWMFGKHWCRGAGIDTFPSLHLFQRYMCSDVRISQPVAVFFDRREGRKCWWLLSKKHKNWLLTSFWRVYLTACGEIRALGLDQNFHKMESNSTRPGVRQAFYTWATTTVLKERERWR